MSYNFSGKRKQFHNCLSCLFVVFFLWKPVLVLMPYPGKRKLAQTSCRFPAKMTIYDLCMYKLFRRCLYLCYNNMSERKQYFWVHCSCSFPFLLVCSVFFLYFYIRTSLKQALLRKPSSLYVSTSAIWDLGIFAKKRTFCGLVLVVHTVWTRF